MKRWIKDTSKALVGIGALNWGLAIFSINVVTMLLGTIPMLVTVVYALIGLSGLIVLAEMLGVKV